MQIPGGGRRAPEPSPVLARKRLQRSSCRHAARHPVGRKFLRVPRYLPSRRIFPASSVLPGPICPAPETVQSPTWDLSARTCDLLKRHAARIRNFPGGRHRRRAPRRIHLSRGFGVRPADFWPKRCVEAKALLPAFHPRLFERSPISMMHRGAPESDAGLCATALEAMTLDR